MPIFQFSTGLGKCYHDGAGLDAAIADCFGPGSEHRDAYENGYGRALPDHRDIRPAGFDRITCPCGENQPRDPGYWHIVAVKVLDRLPNGAELHPDRIAAHVEAEVAFNRDRAARGWSYWDPERGMVPAGS